MSIKFLVALVVGFLALSVVADDKIIPDFKNLAPEWSISGNGKIAEEDGFKYIKLEAPSEGVISGLAYKDIALTGVKQVKISLKYRTNVAVSSTHTGAWFLVGFKGAGADGKIKFDGLFLTSSKQWEKAEKTFNIPPSASALWLELRLQEARDGNVLDAGDICIELKK